MNKVSPNCWLHRGYTVTLTVREGLPNLVLVWAPSNAGYSRGDIVFSGTCLPRGLECAVRLGGK